MLSNSGFDDRGIDYYSQPRGFLTPPPTWRTRRCSPAMPASEKKPMNSSPQSKTDLFHVIHKVPSGDSPYVRAKHVQLIDKDPSKAISLFWAAINSGDRVDSALKDMAVVMKQLDRSNEAIEAIKSFRHLCPPDSQESLDNILLELYKQSGRIEEEIEMLRVKLKQVEEGMTFGGKRIKMARSQGKKVQITVEKEYSRLLGNLAWAYMQHKDFKLAEEHYRKALSFESDKNKQCNLAICLMHMNKLTEAKFLLQAIRVSSENGRCMDESFAKSYERAYQTLLEFESSSPLPLAVDRANSNKAFTDFPYEKRADSDWRRSNNTGQEARKWAYGYASPAFPNRAIPKVPFTQPRKCQGWSTENSCRKLSFGLFDNYDSTPACNEMPKATEFPEKGFSFLTTKPLEDEKSENKMNWADMVEEDEQKFGKWRNRSDGFSFGSPIQERFNDENVDLNIIPESHNNNNPIDQADKLCRDIGMIDLGTGYLTQPGKTSQSANQTVRRSLCFGQNRQLEIENNNNTSPLAVKALNFDEGHGLAVSEDLSSAKSMKRRNRLPVFQDITTQKG
ncbi:protein pollenless 3 [Phtheirospermum japonicum]|uniref:Protein pollenless 3 n=1 Tax=Phtheirospermum japonicum TaxID=374723 RepID=A0A830CFW7_9LAMI|nr:protein pollenless 3 [Phtheirospermum japonicum]